MAARIVVGASVSNRQGHHSPAVRHVALYT